MRFTFKSFHFDFSVNTCIMGILNVTPDSFSDGGQFYDRSKAITHALSMAREGAHIIDIGGESTRPGSEPVSVEQEFDRVIPIIEELSGKIDIPISIDTYKSAVAERALKAGASIINDISGLRFDSNMAAVAAEHDAPLILMHIKGTPKDMQMEPVYDDLMGEITSYLEESISIAKSAGVAEERIIVDPGIGFGKTYEHNLQIIKELPLLRQLGRPVLIGVSRKAFIGNILGGREASERLMGTASAVAISVLNGANIVRVHNVKEMCDVVRVSDALTKSNTV